MVSCWWCWCSFTADELPKTKYFFNSESDFWQPNGATLICLSGVGEVSPHGGVGQKSLYFHKHVNISIGDQAFIKPVSKCLS